ncbi:hypothetical protein RJ640_011824 [Escallonia rubra]|uniref:Transposase (putative) gypsy type domain-containing protein n=1 Tax=Escallonia rubra TaxID=112253 RepID=A0AA88RSI7_9ASTE|nr:hypothetical protein RJ640_011824 [Escallonia rubra]
MAALQQYFIHDYKPHRHRAIDCQFMAQPGATAEDKTNPKPWYTADEKSANYGTKFETGIYEEQVKSGYRLPLHPFGLRFFEHYRMAPGQLVPNGWRKLAGLIYLCKDFKNPGKPTPNNLTKHILSHIKLRGGLSIDEPISEEQLEWAKIIPPKPIPAGLSIHPPPPAIPSVSSAEIVPLEMASGSGKSPQGGFLGVLQKAKGNRKEKQPSAERDDLGMPDNQVSEQHLLHGILPRDKEVFQNQTHETFACSFAQAMYASGSEMLSHFEMGRQVVAEEAQEKSEAVKEVGEATHRAEELSKQEADHSAQIATMEKRLKRAKMRAAEEAKEMFAERFPDIPLDDFLLPAVVSPSGETAMPSEAGDAAASRLPGEGPSGDAPEP